MKSRGWLNKRTACLCKVGEREREREKNGGWREKTKDEVASRSWKWLWVNNHENESVNQFPDSDGPSTLNQTFTPIERIVESENKVWLTS